MTKCAECGFDNAQRDICAGCGADLEARLPPRRGMAISKEAEELLAKVKSGDDEMVMPSTLLVASELVSAGLCTCYNGQDGELYLQMVVAA